MDMLKAFVIKKMINKNIIDKLINLNNINDIDVIFNNFYDIKILLVLAKMKIERLKLIVTDIICHPSIKDFLFESLGLDKENNSIFGINLNYSVDCPNNKIIMLDYIEGIDNLNGRAIAIINFDFDLLKRVNKMKAFW
jgi:hypothetical protein